MPNNECRPMKCWRVFVQLFPSSIRLLSKCFSCHEHFSSSQVAAVFQLLSALANCGEQHRSGAAIDQMRIMADKLRPIDCGRRLSPYIARRQYAYAVAEATGEKKDVQRAREMIELNSADGYLMEQIGRAHV